MSHLALPSARSSSRDLLFCTYGIRSKLPNSCHVPIGPVMYRYIAKRSTMFLMQRIWRRSVHDRGGARANQRQAGRNRVSTAYIYIVNPWVLSFMARLPTLVPLSLAVIYSKSRW